MLAVLILIAPSLEAQVWRLQSSGTTVKLWKIFFVDSARGWACGELGTILRTIDGGEHWSRCTVPDTTMPYFSLFFLDSLRGWAVGRLNVIRTTDGGLSWEHQNPGIRHTFNDVFFIDNENGWIVGGGGFYGVILRTRDAGKNWVVLVDSSRGSYWSVQFLDSAEGWVVGFAGGDNFDPDIILHTTNAGDSWVKQPSPKVGGLNTVLFLDNRTGFAAGLTNTPYGIIRTTDRGEHWEPWGPAHGAIYKVMSMELAGPSHIYVGGSQNFFFRSTDAGIAWSPVALENQKSVTSISCFDSVQCWACGTDGSIWTNRPPITSAIRIADVAIPEDLIECRYSHADRALIVRYHSDKPESLSLDVYTLLFQHLGSRTLTTSPGTSIISLPMEDMDSGMYFLCARIRERSIIRKFLVLKH